MSETSVIKQGPGKDLRLELRSFISSVNPSSGADQTEVIRKSLALLKSLPASKEAVFELLSNIYEKALVDQLNVTENSSLPKADLRLTEAESSIKHFLESCTGKWMLVFSKWALQRLGYLSSKYSSRGVFQLNRSQIDSIGKWMSFKSPKSCVDIYLKCLLSLNETKYECDVVYYLFDACVEYKPHFDWIFPVISKSYGCLLVKHAFSWGLQEFVINEGYGNRPKFNALEFILRSLFDSHSSELKSSMAALIKWSMDEGSGYSGISAVNKADAIVFLLNLSYSSPFLLTAFAADTLSFWNPTDLTKLLEFGDKWSTFCGGKQHLLDLVSHIILSTESSAKIVLHQLLEATRHQHQIIKYIAEEILEFVLKEIDLLLRSTNKKINFLHGLYEDIEWLLGLMLDPDDLIVRTAWMLISYIGKVEKKVLSESVSYVLLRSKQDEHLVSVVRLSEGYSSNQVLSPAVSQSLLHFTTQWDDYTDPVFFWINLSKLLKWEGSGTLVSLPIQEAIWENITSVCGELSRCRSAILAHHIADVVKRTLTGAITMSNNRTPSVHQSLALVDATMTYFYICLTQTEDIEQVKGMKVVTNLITKLSQTCGATARAMVLRELLEGALFHPTAVLFGATLVSPPVTSNTISLLNENHKQGAWWLVAQRHSVLNAGVIEGYNRRRRGGCIKSSDQITRNTFLLINCIRAACASDSNQGFLDGVVNFSLLLVQLISPDVMYNGLPWPEDEFCKVTVERDLCIRRTLEQVPLVWSLLSFIAYCRPALCYCSVILRAVMATLIAEWSTASQQGRGAGHCSKLIETTGKLLDIMTLSQLLPAPLSAVSLALPHLDPAQVVEVLKDCIWSYMRDHVPSPALFTRDPNGSMWRDPATSKPSKLYTEPFRLVILANIPSLGTLYHILFIQDTVDDE